MVRNRQGAFQELQADPVSEFEAIVMPLRDELHRAALWLTHCYDSADDLVQETLVHAFRGFSQFQRGTDIKAWLMHILKNLFISHYRHQRRSVQTVSLEGLLEEAEFSEESNLLLLDESPSPEEQILAKVMDEEVQKALQKLPEAFRKVVMLCDLEGLSYAEAAETLKVPVGTIRSRLSRGREMLRRLLWDYASNRRWV